MPKLAKDFFVVVPGKIHPETLPAGADVEGELAEIAAACGVLEDGEPSKARKAARRAPETQAFTAAPETKG